MRMGKTDAPKTKTNKRSHFKGDKNKDIIGLYTDFFLKK